MSIDIKEDVAIVPWKLLFKVSSDVCAGDLHVFYGARAVRENSYMHVGHRLRNIDVAGREQNTENTAR
jgi:hypothetical protein